MCGCASRAGYALSIFIPVSCVCVLPYEAVRWALIGVATLTSGLFLLLNFRGPIFDVAGAKCAPCLGVNGSVADWAFLSLAAHVHKRRPAPVQLLSFTLLGLQICLGSVMLPYRPCSLQALVVAYTCGCCCFGGLPV